MATPFRHHRGEVASLSRSRPPDDPDLIRAKALMREARVIEHITALVHTEPPLGPEARARIASVLAHPAAQETNDAAVPPDGGTGVVPITQAEARTAGEING